MQAEGIGASVEKSGGEGVTLRLQRLAVDAGCVLCGRSRYADVWAWLSWPDEARASGRSAELVCSACAVSGLRPGLLEAARACEQQAARLRRETESLAASAVLFRELARREDWQLDVIRDEEVV
jgi:hypothetical protein